MKMRFNYAENQFYCWNYNPNPNPEYPNLKKKN